MTGFFAFFRIRNATFAFPALRALHVAEIAVFLAALWWIARRLTGNVLVAWLAVTTALVCKDLTVDARRILTEPLFLASIGPMLVFWLATWLEPQRLMTAFFLGFFLAATILVKPVFIALVPALFLLYGAAWLAGQNGVTAQDATRSCAIAFAVCVAALGPFYMASFACCGRLSLSDPALLEAALSHRVAYNDMSLREWLAGWVYYLPDFGDDLAPALFPDLVPFRLGWDDNSYYIHGRDVLHPLMSAGAAPHPATGALIREFVIADPLWHSMTSALLFWRGLFVGKLWALVALPFLIACLFWPSDDKRAAFIALCVPVFFIAALQSGVSVSIPRYNLGLIVPMSLAFAWTIVVCIHLARSRLRLPAS